MHDMKKIFILLVAVLTATPLLAQSDVTDQFEVQELTKGKPKKHTFLIGPKIGATMNTMTDPNDANLVDGMGFGFSAGAVIGMRFNRASEGSPAGTGPMGIAFELKYKQQQVKTLGTDEKGKANANFGTNYFEAPVTLQWYPFYKKSGINGLYIEAGAAFAALVGNSPKSLTANNICYKFDMDGSKLKGGDIRPLVGLGWTTNCGLNINARYLFGTSDLASNLPSKMSNFEISLGWIFNIPL